MRGGGRGGEGWIRDVNKGGGREAPRREQACAHLHGLTLPHTTLTNFLLTNTCSPSPPTHIPHIHLCHPPPHTHTPLFSGPAGDKKAMSEFRRKQQDERKRLDKAKTKWHADQVGSADGWWVGGRRGSRGGGGERTHCANFTQGAHPHSHCLFPRGRHLCMPRVVVSLQVNTFSPPSHTHFTQSSFLPPFSQPPPPHTHTKHPPSHTHTHSHPPHPSNPPPNTPITTTTRPSVVVSVLRPSAGSLMKTSGSQKTGQPQRRRWQSE